MIFLLNLLESHSVIGKSLIFGRIVVDKLVTLDTANPFPNHMSHFWTYRWWYDLHCRCFLQKLNISRSNTWQSHKSDTSWIYSGTIVDFSAVVSVAGTCESGRCMHSYDAQLLEMPMNQKSGDTLPSFSTVDFCDCSRSWIVDGCTHDGMIRPQSLVNRGFR